MLPFRYILMSQLGRSCLVFSLLALAFPAVVTADDPPNNDVCAQAALIAQGDFAFSTTGAGTDGPDSSECTTLGSTVIFNDVWFEFTPPESGTLHISTCGQASFDTRIALYVGDCGELIEVGCNDDGLGCSGYTSNLLAPSLEGERYLIRIGSFHPAVGGVGTVSVSVQAPCFTGCEENVRSELEICGEFVNDGCTGGLLSVENGAFERKTAYGHEEIDLNETVCGQWHFDGVVRDTDWYRLSVPEPGATLSLVLESSEFIEGNLYIASESCPITLLEYVSGGCPTSIDLDWVPAGYYQVIVAPGFERVIECGAPQSMDHYSLSVIGDVSTENAPVNDGCSEAVLIEDGLHSFSTFYATTDGPPNSPEECGEYETAIGADIWFDYISTIDGEVTASICERADFDTRLEIWQGGCSGVLVACNDDSPDCSDFTSKVSFSAVCGELYTVRVAGYQMARGDGSLEMSSEGSCCFGDLDGDGLVSGSDLATFLAVWGSDDSRADFDGDGIVNGADLAAILAAWGEC
jgi:hypothetical protein